MSARIYSQFFGDFFFASCNAENDVSMPKTCLCCKPILFVIIPIDEPYSITKFFDGIFEIFDLIF